MKQKAWFVCFVILCLVLFFFKSLPAAGKPDITRHDATFLENCINMHIEWQSPNPVTLVKISMTGVEKEIKIDPYDNKRNRDGYAGEVSASLNIGSTSGQSFTYIIQLEDELRIKSSPVTGKVKTSLYQQPVTFPQTQQPGMSINIQQSAPATQAQQPGMEIKIQQKISPPQDQSVIQTSEQRVGAVIVIIDPLMVAQSGAMWRADNGEWKKDGDIMSNLSEGFHTIEFKDVNNWIKPENENVLVQSGQTITINGIYKNR